MTWENLFNILFYMYALNYPVSYNGKSFAGFTTLANTLNGIQ